jgi:myo-inositol-1(or 4)-monophosphatase
MTEPTPRTAPLTEAEEDRLPVLMPVFDTKAARLFIGNKVAAESPDLLLAGEVTSTMNLAVNIEMRPLTLADGTAVRRTHIGLIDGPGNTPRHLLGAVLTVAGILGQASPGKAHYPPHRPGNLLVHCRGGRSRSATVLALYLTLAHGEAFPSFEAAINHVRARRGLGTDQPQPAMLDLAARALELLGSAPLLGQGNG